MKITRYDNLSEGFAGAKELCSWEDWARWIAVDEDGKVYAYKHPPVLSKVINGKWTNNVIDVSSHDSFYALIGSVDAMSAQLWEELVFPINEDK